MSRELQKRLFILQLLVAVLVFGSIWWIYGKSFRSKFQEEKVENKSNNDYIDYYESNPKNIKNIKAKIKAKVNDISKIIDDPPPVRYIPKPIGNKKEKDLLKTYDPNHKYIEKLKKMLKGNDLSRDVNFEEDFLRAYIITNNNNIDKAFTKILNYLNLRIEHDELFHNISFDFTQNPAYRFVSLLPHRGKDGSATILFEIGKWDPDVVPFVHLKRMLFMIYMQELRNPLTQANGFSAIYDFKDIGFRYVKYASPQNLHLLNHVAHEVMPVVFVGIHLVNINVLANLLIAIIRPFLPAFIERVFYVHSSLEGLLNFFPISTLPAQYGGHLIDFYPADWIRRANEQHDKYPPGGQKNVF